MSMTCTICRHDKRKEIDADIISGKSLRSIAKQYGTSAAAVLRHKEKHLPQTLMKAKEADEAQHGESLLVQIRRLSAETQEILTAAKKAKDYDTQLKAIAQSLKNLELEGKLLGELGKPKTPPSRQSHLHLHGNDAVRAFVLATKRLPTQEEFERLRKPQLTGQADAEKADVQSKKKPTVM